MYAVSMICKFDYFIVAITPAEGIRCSTNMTRPMPFNVSDMTK